MTSGDVDAYVASWIPQQNEMFLPLRDAKAIDVIGVNVDQADTGLCVPTYVWEVGVHSVADLDSHADKFDRTIYGIEVGSGMHSSTEEMVQNDVAGLGDWEQVGSTTPVIRLWLRKQGPRRRGKGLDRRKPRNRRQMA